MKTTKGSLIKLANPIIKNKELIPKIKNYLQKDSAYIYIYILKITKKAGVFVMSIEEAAEPRKNRRKGNKPKRANMFYVITKKGEMGNSTE